MTAGLSSRAEGKGAAFVPHGAHTQAHSFFFLLWLLFLQDKASRGLQTSSPPSFFFFFFSFCFVCVHSLFQSQKAERWGLAPTLASPILSTP